MMNGLQKKRGGFSAHARQRMSVLFAAVFSVFTACFLLLNSVAAADTPHPVRFGISEFADYSVNLPAIPATANLLEEVLGEENVKAKVYPVAELQRKAKAGELDIILSSAGTYRRLVLEGAGVRDLASLASDRVANPNYADGSVFFARRDRTDIATIRDLEGKTVAATHRYAFSGWQTAMGELYRRGLPTEHFFRNVRFKGHEMVKVVDAVRSGEVDAGIVRACFLEDMGIDLRDFRVIEPRPQKGRIACVHSTDLYPNWTISTLPGLSPEISRKIAAALFSMPPIENGVRWSIANDYRGIDALFKNLRIGPYEYLQHFSVKRFLQQYWPAFAILLTCLIALILHSVTVSALVRKRTAQLEESLKREARFQTEAREAEARFHVMQKVGIVGQMSSIIAHELRQPLGSISLYCYGLLRKFESGTEDRAATVRSVEKILAQTERASGIVSQVRSYAKGSRQRGPLDAVNTIEAALAEIRKTLRSQQRIDFHKPQGSQIFVEANPLELELIVINLVKNAAEAAAALPEAAVTVVLAADASKVQITVTNTGPVIDEKTWQAIQNTSLVSSKETGLGLGLSIVRSLTEDMGGRLVFERPATGGLSVTVELVRLKTGGEHVG